jgi:GntR family transcriptional regulator, histidine utilization repressor
MVNNLEDVKFGFREVKADIIRRSQSRQWAPGAALPGEVELAAEFGCARATVNRAMRELSDEGVIDRKRKSGTRVKLSPVRQARFEIPLVRIEVETSGAQYRYSLVSRERVDAPDWLRSRLELGVGAKVLHLHCMHYADGAPFQFEDRWINPAAVPHAEQADFSEISPNEWLVREVPFTDAEIQFTATAATPALSEFLLMDVGEPVFTADRTTWLKAQAVTNTRLYFRRDYRMIARY